MIDLINMVIKEELTITRIKLYLFGF